MIIIIIMIIMIIIIIISFMQGIYTYIPETNHVSREYSVSSILSLLFMVPILLVPALALLYFYVSTFRSMCAVPNMAVFCSSFTSWIPGMLLMYFLNDFEMVPVAPILLVSPLFLPSTCVVFLLSGPYILKYIIIIIIIIIIIAAAAANSKAFNCVNCVIIQILLSNVNDGSWGNVNTAQDNTRHVLKLIRTVESGVLNSAFSVHGLKVQKGKVYRNIEILHSQTPVLLSVTVDW